MKDNYLLFFQMAVIALSVFLAAYVNAPDARQSYGPKQRVYITVLSVTVAGFTSIGVLLRYI